MTSTKARKDDAEAPDQSDPMRALRTKLKACDPEIQKFVAALEAENLRSEKKIAKLQAENVTLNSRITLLEENTNERCVYETPPIECLQKAHELIDAQIKESEKAQSVLREKYNK